MVNYKKLQWEKHKYEIWSHLRTYSLCVYVHVCAWVYILQILLSVYVCKPALISLSLSIYIYIYMCVCVCVCIYMCVCVCVCVCVWICMYKVSMHTSYTYEHRQIYIHTHTDTHTHAYIYIYIYNVYFRLISYQLSTVIDYQSHPSCSKEVLFNACLVHIKYCFQNEMVYWNAYIYIYIYIYICVCLCAFCFLSLKKFKELWRLCHQYETHTDLAASKKKVSFNLS